MSKNIRKAYHPSEFIKDYLEAIEMTQDDFAKRLGISGKQLSLILSENASITVDIAYKLSKLIGTSAQIWLNLQNRYDTYQLYLKEQEQLEEEMSYFKMIDKKFLNKLNIIEKTDKKDEILSKLCRTLKVSSLRLLEQPDIQCFYRTSIKKDETLENIVCRNVWVSLAVNIAKKQKVNEFNEEKLLNYIDKFKLFTTTSPEYFYPQLKDMLSECGVSLVILPSLKNSNINGVVKWIDPTRVMMALNTRGAYNDKFWFSFFHELKHVLQKAKRKMIIGEENVNPNYEITLEYEADLFAKETLIASNDFEKLNSYDEESVVAFAKSINIHPGIVVGRLQKENKIPYSRLNHLKEKYEINIEDQLDSNLA